MTVHYKLYIITHHITNYTSLVACKLNDLLTRTMWGGRRKFDTCCLRFSSSIAALASASFICPDIQSDKQLL